MNNRMMGDIAQYLNIELSENFSREELQKVCSNIEFLWKEATEWYLVFFMLWQTFELLKQICWELNAVMESSLMQIFLMLLSLLFSLEY